MNGDDSPKINHDEPGFGRTGFGRDEIYPDKWMIWGYPDYGSVLSHGGPPGHHT